MNLNLEGLSKVHSVQNIIADGSELVNLVMGKQDSNFQERKAKEQVKKEKVFNPQTIIQETVSEESGSTFKTNSSLQEDSGDEINDKESNKTFPIIYENDINLESGMGEINYKTSTAGIGKGNRIKTVQSDIDNESQTNEQNHLALSSNALEESMEKIA